VRFDFATATRIVFAAGAAAELPALARPFGRRALAITGRNQQRSAETLQALGREGMEWSTFPVAGEPTVDVVRSGAERARRERAELIIGFGGGSAIDAAKAIAALAANEGDVLDYLEVIGNGRPLERPPLGFIAIPTTAGTGAEVTRNAVLGSPEHRVKASLRSPLLLPKVALIDPLLTLHVPADVTASTGLDTLTQLIEPYVSVRANDMTDMFCLEGLRRVRTALKAAYRNGRDAEAREAMSFAALLGGLALANAALGVVHGFAAPMGGMFPAPHGAICAALLPHGMAMNIEALRRRDASGRGLRRYETIARTLTGDENAAPENGVDWVRELCRELRVPPLSAYGIERKHAGEIAEKASKASSMKGNPIALRREELISMVERAL
jgi:alcohol dehydrogenase class IV